MAEPWAPKEKKPERSIVEILDEIGELSKQADIVQEHLEETTCNVVYSYSIEEIYQFLDISKFDLNNLECQIDWYRVRAACIALYAYGDLDGDHDSILIMFRKLCDILECSEAPALAKIAAAQAIAQNFDDFPKEENGARLTLVQDLNVVLSEEENRGLYEALSDILWSVLGEDCSLSGFDEE